MASGFAVIFAILLSILFAANLIFYAPFVISLYISFRLFNKRRTYFGSIALIVGISPILYYYYSKNQLYIEFQNRVAEVNSWPRKPVKQKGDIKSIRVVSGRIDSELLDFAIVDTVAAYGKVHHRDWGEHCVSQAHAQEDFFGAVRARNAFFSCSKVDETGVQPKFDAVLYSGRTNIGRRRECQGPETDENVEFRWNNAIGGGALIAYHEVASRKELVGPWISPDKKQGLYLSKCVVDKPETPFDGLAFVTNAMGYHVLDDYPQYAVSADALKALRILSAEKNNRTKEAVMLLGQWPSTPEFSHFIRTELRDDKWTYQVLSRMTSGNQQFELLPYLKSHAADFLAICPETLDNSAYCEVFAKKLENKI
ncbi:hypothetical protein V1T76_06135 [Roseibium sp. FZY0029]|uniref:hypothetical protein n=1 Tax=Roseibium sp. FZY0029 TaxID=3116647 RepID=UPI002EC4E37C|nr:hypothetical protein [Roseibium sp. FZY0029]